jgi:hypothetical protein
MSVKFSAANTKIKKLAKLSQFQRWLSNKRKIYSFDLLSGFSCPAAKDCLSRAIQTSEGRRIEDGPDTEFRCFSASQEVVYTNVYNLRKGNFDALRGCTTVESMVDLIQSAFPKNAGIIRIHVAGDFFNRLYFLAWLEIARKNPSVLFYAYTKQLPLVIENADKIPDNLVLTASRGGKYDEMIEIHDMRSSTVVESEDHAAALGLPVDNDDSHAADPDKRSESFALVIHGTQPKGRKKLSLPVLT